MALTEVNQLKPTIPVPRSGVDTQPLGAVLQSGGQVLANPNSFVQRQPFDIPERLGSSAVDAATPDAGVESVTEISERDAACDRLFAENDGLAAVRPVTPAGIDMEAAEAYLDARLTFVKQMGWLEDIETDRDVYDTDPNTIYCLKMKRLESDEIGFVAGQRLTRVPAVEQSLSFGMLADNPDMQAQLLTNVDEKVQRAVSAGNLWDLTRMVAQFDGTATPQELGSGVPEAIGVGFRETCPPGVSDVAWLFVTTKEFKGYLEKKGITHKVLAEGSVSSRDAEKGIVSYFCYVDPAAAMDFLRDSHEARHQRTYELINKASELSAGRDAGM